MPNQSLRTIFNEALDRHDSVERARYLQTACGEDAALRERVEKLLRAHDDAGGFLDAPTEMEKGPRGTVVVQLTEKAGAKIGRYKLLQEIGEGGCGVVYMAEQEEPVRRRVALKVIKLGMDTKSVVARFEAERQALAMMDHPNIAKVLDAGATETGRPYFVMELVRGTKITKFCDEHKLSPRERLELFIQVCSAVQHAHQKGIIHRDIKPSNILVTMLDGVPIPKVIDFGIAKATNDQRLTDKTVFTAFEQFIGTPAYMSPEQAEMSAADIDTRTDIYSLGVVLYELLTGQTPFDSQQLFEVGLDALRRTIREEDPPKPSTRLNTLAQGDLTTVAKARQVEPPKLIHLVAGDLDWVVMKCLEKDRNRRYETANGLASDIQRHLQNEPVAARPPNGAYRFQKFVRRNKLAFAAGTIVLLALLAGIGGSMWQAIRARRAEREQIRLRQEAQAHEKKAQEAAKRATHIADFTDSVFTDLSKVFSKKEKDPHFLEVLDNAVVRVRKELKSDPVVLAALLTRIGRLYGQFSDRSKGEALSWEALSLLKMASDKNSDQFFDAVEAYVLALRGQSKNAEAEKFLQTTIASIPQPAIGQANETRRLADLWGTLAWVQEMQGKLVEAETSMVTSQSLLRRIDSSAFDSRIPAYEIRLGKFDAAEAYWREYLQYFRAHTNLSATSYGLYKFIDSLQERGDYEKASEFLQEIAKGDWWGDVTENLQSYSVDHQFRLGVEFLRIAWAQYNRHQVGQALSAAIQAEKYLRDCIRLERKQGNDFENGKSVLADALVVKAAADLDRSITERVALLKEAEPLVTATLDGSQYLRGATTNKFGSLLERHKRLYAIWNELSPSAERTQKAAQWENELASWLARTNDCDRVWLLTLKHNFSEAEILCRQALAETQKQTEPTPKQARLFYELGSVFDNQGKYKECFQAYEQALRVSEQCQPPIPAFRRHILFDANHLLEQLDESVRSGTNRVEVARGLLALLSEHGGLVKDAVEGGKKNECLQNLRQLDGAKYQWALDHSKRGEEIPTPKELWGLAGYLPGELKCPSGGTYIIGQSTARRVAVCMVLLIPMRHRSG